MYSCDFDCSSASMLLNYNNNNNNEDINDNVTQIRIQPTQYRLSRITTYVIGAGVRKSHGNILYIFDPHAPPARYHVI